MSTCDDVVIGEIKKSMIDFSAVARGTILMKLYSTGSHQCSVIYI